jgi:hypothetical protein
MCLLKLQHLQLVVVGPRHCCSTWHTLTAATPMQMLRRFMGLAVSMMSDAAWRDVLRAEEASSFARTLRCAWGSGFRVWSGFATMNVCWSPHELKQLDRGQHTGRAAVTCLFTLQDLGGAASGAARQAIQPRSAHGGAGELAGAVCVRPDTLGQHAASCCRCSGSRFRMSILASAMAQHSTSEVVRMTCSCCHVLSAPVHLVVCVQTQSDSGVPCSICCDVQRQQG